MSNPVPVSKLILPIVVSSVVIFLLSFAIRMATPLHDGDYGQLPNEAVVMQISEQIPGGRYIYPWASRADAMSPEFQERYEQGPRGMMVVYDEPLNFPAALGFTFLFYLVAGAFVAFLASKAILAGAAFAAVFKFTAVAAFAAHGLGWLPQMIWYQDIALVPTMVDSILFALATGAVFGLMWPKSSAAATPSEPEAA